MSRLIIAVALALIAVLVALFFWTGADVVVRIWAMEGQQTAQTAIARALRALRAGEPAALTALFAVCFGYGFFHAVGPGHGKMVIGGYGVAARVGAVKLSLVALASSLSQGLTAIILVSAGLWLWGWSRSYMTDLAEDLFAPISFAAIACVGLWLCYRGVRGMRALHQNATAHDAHHAHDHTHNHTHDDTHQCAVCGHAHAPDPEHVAAAEGWRDIVALIMAVAIRPCTGALFLLILTAQMGIFHIGVAGALAMALGTASVTIAIAIASVTLRQGVLTGVAGWNVPLARAVPILEILVGACVAIIAGQIAFGLI